MARERTRDKRLRLFLLAIFLLAAPALQGCWARVPAVFEPPPPRLDAGRLEFDDLRADERIVVVLLGDAGTGNEEQFEVARHLTRVCADRGCDLALLLGDNFYDNGVRPARRGVWDEAFVRKFEAPYEGLDLRFWAVAGNHDWHGGRASVDTQVAYSLRSQRWRMPAYDYSVPGLPPWLTIYALDTVVLLADADIGQTERARSSLCAASGWRILVGHHPIYSTGHHAGSSGENAAARNALLPLIRDCGIDLYAAGHEHHQEHLRAGTLDQIVQGAGGRSLRRVGVRRTSSPVEQLFAASMHGFALLEISRAEMTVEFFGYPPETPEGFGSIYRAIIRRRSTGEAGRR